jgi:site-specific recombinase XerD
MASLEKVQRSGGTAYRIRYRLGKRELAEYLPLNTPQSNVKAILAEFDKRLALHKLGAAFLSPLRDNGAPITLSGFRDWFLETKKTAIRRGRPVHKKTQDTYRYAFEKLISAVGDVRASITPHQARTFETALEVFSPTTRSIIIRSLRAAWEMGIEEGILTENPFRKMAVSTDRKVPIVLTNEEKDRIFEKIENKEARLGFALARYAGLRRVEICGNVKWEDVDFDSGLLTIPEGKTGQGQQVPILPPLAQILKENRKPEGFIVNLHQHTLTHYLEKAQRAAGVKKPGAVRILRHSLGAGLLSQGVDIRTIQLVLRHASISTTQIYTKIPAAAVRKLLEGKNL